MGSGIEEQRCSVSSFLSLKTMLKYIIILSLKIDSVHVVKEALKSRLLVYYIIDRKALIRYRIVIILKIKQSSCIFLNASYCYTFAIAL